MTESGKLYVFYDETCALCRRCRVWLAAQPAYIPLDFIAFQSKWGPQLFPGMEDFNPAEELLVINEQGEVYQGSRAWIMCLYALKEYRPYAFKMAQPGWRHLAKKLVRVISTNRQLLSKFFDTKGNLPVACDPEGECGI